MNIKLNKNFYSTITETLRGVEAHICHSITQEAEAEHFKFQISLNYIDPASKTNKQNSEVIARLWRHIAMLALEKLRQVDCNCPSSHSIVLGHLELHCKILSTVHA